ncbi:MAG: 2-pyrone-4,6-dicarboxylate hydrolase [Alphaproteobacteria bacterium]|nr:MAG: 2-pyrone-4,6-dicarboxylate hydrolase [Alphaproteobacteria bacterium]
MATPGEPLPAALPPDPDTRPPGWALPPGACDSHFHVFGPPHRFPFAASRRYQPPAAPIEDYWKVQKITGLARAVVVQPTVHGTDHAAILDAIARSEGRLLGVACIDRDMTDAALASLKAAGIRAARFSLMSDRAGSRDAMAKLIDRVARLDWSLVLHIEPRFLLAHEDFIRGLPVATVIDHMARIDPREGLGQPAFALLLDLLADGRFWTKICCVDKISAAPRAEAAHGPPFADMVPFAKAVIAAAPDRVIWGSDWPHGNTFAPGRTPNEGDLLDLLGVMAPDQAARRAILVDNPARLYRFEGEVP